MALAPTNSHSLGFTVQLRSEGLVWEMGALFWPLTQKQRLSLAHMVVAMGGIGHGGLG
jgi:hypothetical protein